MNVARILIAAAIYLPTLSALPDGTVVIGDHGSLIRIAPEGAVQKMPVHSGTNERYSFMGIWPGVDGSIYVADYGSSAVKRISPSGVVTTAATSHIGWQPAGGLVAPDGSLWILETSPDNEQRVRRVDPSGSSPVF